jgi:3-dehydroquinate dehydratase/shikimate dehydrogenase
MTEDTFPLVLSLTLLYLEAMATKLTVPIAAPNLQQANRQIKVAKTAGAEMLELRTDYLQNLNVDLVKKLIAQAKAATMLPLIVTCRDKKQGGAIDYPLQLRLDVLAAALNAGAEFVDCEYENFLPAENREKIELALSQNSKARLILSAHSFESKFDNIEKHFRQILAVCPDAIPKLIYTANHINDCFEAFDLLHNTGGERIIFCMGEAGLISRIIAKKLGSFVTFASVDDKTATAPGQLTIEQLKTIFRWDSINSDTELYGIIGSPVAHSLSPVVHNACFADIGANKLYLPLLVAGGQGEFNQFMDNCLSRAWLGFRGFSVTIPHKENALNYIKSKGGLIDPLAEKIGAINTLIIDEGRGTSDDRRISAYNTDCPAALDAIIAGLGIDRSGLYKMPVAVIGAGGAARAIVAGLDDADAIVTIYNRTAERGRKLAAEFNCNFAPLDDLPNLNAKLVINATSIGMKRTEGGRQRTEDRGQKTGYETPILKKYLKSDMVVFDTIYNPAETLLLKQAKQLGCRTIPGLSMFLNQAAAQFKLFTGKNPNMELMRKIVSAAQK